MHCSNSAILLVLSLGIGCSAVQTGSGQTSEQQRITNVTFSDVGVCFSEPPAVPDAINSEILTGLLVNVRPVVLECFVDPKNHGKESETRVNVKSTFSVGKVDHAITGQNLTPDGEKCIRGVLDRSFSAIPNWSNKTVTTGSSVTAEAQYHHVQGTMPTVTMGINEVSDIVGSIRLAQATWCDCYADWKDVAPHTLKAKLRVIKAANKATAQATFEPTKDPVADKVAACLQGKIAALPVQMKSQELDFPYTFLLFHSGHAGPLTSAPPDLQFQQMDVLRGKATAQTAIALGARTIAAQKYDALVNKYKANEASVSVDELKNGCAALVKADDDWIAAVQKQLDADQQTLTLLGQLKAQDPAWAKAEGAVQQSMQETKNDQSTVQKMKTADQNACPKET